MSYKWGFYCFQWVRRWENCFIVLLKTVQHDIWLLTRALAVDGTEYYSWYTDSHIQYALQYTTCICNGLLCFTWKLSPWSLTAVNSPLSKISQPAQSDMLKHTSTMNISHLETNTTKSMGSLYSLCTAQRLKLLPQSYFFNQSPHTLSMHLLSSKSIFCTLHWSH